MSEQFYQRLVSHLDALVKWSDPPKGERVSYPGHLRPFLNECMFQSYDFTEDQTEKLIQYSENLMGASYRLFLDLASILAYCGVKGYPDMTSSIEIDPYLIRKTDSHPGEIAARCLSEIGFFKEGEFPFYYDYGKIGFYEPKSKREGILILTNFRAIAIGSIYHDPQKVYRLEYPFPKKYLKSLDYIYLDQRLHDAKRSFGYVSAFYYAKFFSNHKDKRSKGESVALKATASLLKVYKIRGLLDGGKIEPGYHVDWLPIIFDVVEFRDEVGDLQKSFDKTLKENPEYKRTGVSYPYDKKSFDKKDRSNRMQALFDRIIDIHDIIKDENVAWKTEQV
ncbi:MAG: hypothetical protein ACFFCP_07215 [Promethearchaeota archaeon]